MEIILNNIFLPHSPTWYLALKVPVPSWFCNNSKTALDTSKANTNDCVCKTKASHVKSLAQQNVDFRNV